MRIGILETGKVPAELAEKHGTYIPMFQRLIHSADPDIALQTYSVVDFDFPASHDACDGWIITGSRHGVYDDLPWMSGLKHLIRAAYANRVPLVGVCFGHQIIADALGGRVERFSGGWNCGVHSYQIEIETPWMQGESKPAVDLLAMHQDQVIDLPEEAQVWAHSPSCAHAFLIYGDPQAPGAISMQPHPEFDAQFEHDLIKSRADRIPAEISEPAIASLQKPQDSPLMARWITTYFRQADALRQASSKAA
ncbi:MAG: gamma-glutamyl-gamma-aminobutyrate hydrolase family protein [Neomegalonema sp.]|nr:gamma-glutamyl-gamma-aminobutyrate hydrolase family protein [Neomegalonema sp.]